MKQSAFPISGSQYRHTEGMTLRDYFAAKAMQGYMYGAPSNDDINIALNTLAEMSYKVADVMLKSRGE